MSSCIIAIDDQPPVGLHRHPILIVYFYSYSYVAVSISNHAFKIEDVDVAFENAVAGGSGNQTDWGMYEFTVSSVAKS